MSSSIWGVGASIGIAVVAGIVGAVAIACTNCCIKKAKVRQGGSVLYDKLPQFMQRSVVPIAERSVQFTSEWTVGLVNKKIGKGLAKVFTCCLGNGVDAQKDAKALGHLFNSLSVGPILEEAVYRVGIQRLVIQNVCELGFGFIIGNKSPVLAKICAVALTSIVFGLSHGKLNSAEAVKGIAGGIVLGSTYTICRFLSDETSQQIVGSIKKASGYRFWLLAEASGYSSAVLAHILNNASTSTKTLKLVFVKMIS